MRKRFLMQAAVALLLAQQAIPALLPEKAGSLVRTRSLNPTLASRTVWDEYGLEETDQAVYHSGVKLIEVTAYRFKDPTGAFAAGQWQAGADPKLRLVQRDNYLLTLAGGAASEEELKPLWAALPKVASGPPPNLSNYLPAPGLIDGSRRYLLGEASLKEFLPQVSVSAAGFASGAEAAVGQYDTGGGKYPLAIFSYPTPQIARLQLAEFEKLPDAKAIRTGPFVAVTFPGAVGGAAEQTLNSVSYSAVVTLNQGIPKKQPNVGVTMISIFILAGILIALCLIGGLGVGILRLYGTRFGRREADEEITALHLSDN